MKKRVIKLFLICLVFIAVRVKADPNLLLADSEYTTVVSGDSFSIRVGSDTVWDEALLKDYKSTSGQLMPFYFAVPKELKVDLSGVKYHDTYYDFDHNFEFKESVIEGKRYYIFSNVYARSIRESDNDVDDMYDGLINNTLISNIKINVDKKVKGVYDIETGFFDDEGERIVISILPITVIEKEGSKKLNFINFISESEGVGKTRNNSISIEDGKYVYDVLFYTNADYVNYINAGCDSRCKVKYIGNDSYFDIKIYNQIKVIFDKNNSYVYKFNNEQKLATIDCSWANEFSYSKEIIIIGNNDTNNDTYYSKFAKEPENLISYKHYYEYDSLNEVDKRIISELLDDQFNKVQYEGPYIYIVSEDKVIYKHKGELSKEELDSIYKLTGLYNNNSNNKYTSNNNIDYMRVALICMNIIIVLLIIVIIILLIKRKKNQIKE